MLKRSASSRANSFGFSLIELMVVVAIAGILLAIAIPAYNTSIRKSRRTEAKTTLVDLAGREERYYDTNNNAYTASPTALGYSATATTFPMTVGSGYYSVSVTAPAVVAPAAPTYLITAVPITVDQLKDTSCLYFSIDNLGNQLAGASAGAAVSGSPCWQ
jgi:type IV pilus assembly protein PilE